MCGLGSLACPDSGRGAPAATCVREPSLICSSTIYSSADCAALALGRLPHPRRGAAQSKRAQHVFYEARHHVLGGPPLTRAPRRRAALGSQEERPEKLAVSRGRSLRHTALYEAQVLVVAAAGNERRNPCGCTGIYCDPVYNPVTTPDKLLVGATTSGGELSSFSNYGACVHVQVPPPPHPHPKRSARKPLRRVASRGAMPHGAPATRVHRRPAPLSWRRGSAQATPPPGLSAAPAWRRRMSPASPPSCSGGTRPSRWRGSRS